VFDSQKNLGIGLEKKSIGLALGADKNKVLVLKYVLFTSLAIWYKPISEQLRTCRQCATRGKL